MQGQSGLRGPLVVQQGGTFEVEVAPNDDAVEVTAGGQQHGTRHEVQPGKKATIPVPPVPPGTILVVTVGTGLRRRVHILEVISLQ